jgi:hypothetical protein
MYFLILIKIILRFKFIVDIIHFLFNNKFYLLNLNLNYKLKITYFFNI